LQGFLPSRHNSASDQIDPFRKNHPALPRRSPQRTHNQDKQLLFNNYQFCTRNRQAKKSKIIELDQFSY
jgi:hypothetical protein